MSIRSVLAANLAAQSLSTNTITRGERSSAPSYGSSGSSTVRESSLFNALSQALTSFVENGSGTNTTATITSGDAAATSDAATTDAATTATTAPVPPPGTSSNSGTSNSSGDSPAQNGVAALQSFLTSFLQDLQNSGSAKSQGNLINTAA
jgi:hypothetical protein